MSFFGKLLGSDKALGVAANVVESGMKLADNAFYTDQEKAEHKTDMIKNWIAIQEVINKESSPRSISRRVIAWFVMGMAAFLLLQGSIFIAIGANERLENLLQLAEALKIEWAFTGVIGFYFLAHVFKKGVKNG